MTRDGGSGRLTTWAALASGWQRWRADRGWVVLAILVAFLLAWELAVRAGGLSAFILPAPSEIVTRFWRLLWNGTLLYHTWVTMQEVLVGLGMGAAVSVVLGYGLARSPLLERVLSPYIVALQAVPTVAIAPLLVVFLGPGFLSKVLVAALIVFFPMLVNTVVGLRSVDPGLRDLMRALEATRWQTFAQLEVPAALPVLLGGLRIGATLSVIGAVVGEFVSSTNGLGYLVKQGQNFYDTALMFVAVAMLSAMALAFYGSVALLERWLLAWKR